MSSKKSKRPEDNSPTNPDEKCRYPESTNRRVYIEPGIQIDFVKDLREEYNACQKETSSHQPVNVEALS
jgi:hypothetical protein